LNTGRLLSGNKLNFGILFYSNDITIRGLNRKLLGFKNLPIIVANMHFDSQQINALGLSLKDII
jgi:hypothetical protein